MYSLARKYKPILSTPFGREGYREISPCSALKPFVRCFWTERQTADDILVIPDTCMDIIFRTGGDAFFCALDERSFYSERRGEELFGVRFHAWTAQLFSRRDFSKSGGRAFPAEEFFDDFLSLECAIQRALSFEERVLAAECWLLKHLDSRNVDNDLLNAVDFIIDSRGALEISELRAYTAVSARKLERLFSGTMGISPKAFSSLVRYQFLWREMAFCEDFNSLDAVEKFGYADQSHLINDFRKHHLMNPGQAIEYAKKPR